MRVGRCDSTDLDDILAVSGVAQVTAQTVEHEIMQLRLEAAGAVMPAGKAWRFRQ